MSKGKMASGSGASAGKRSRKIRIRAGRLARVWRFLQSPLGATLFGVAMVVAAVGGVVYNHYYWEFRKIIDSRLEGGAFDLTARFLATPRTISVGDPGSAVAIANAPAPARLEFENGRVSRITLEGTGRSLSAYRLEPELITNLFDQERSKRRLFKFEDYPKHLVDAVIAIEDHRFFSHFGATSRDFDAHAAAGPELLPHARGHRQPQAVGSDDRAPA